MYFEEVINSKACHILLISLQVYQKYPRERERKLYGHSLNLAFFVAIEGKNHHASLRQELQACYNDDDIGRYNFLIPLIISLHSNFFMGLMCLSILGMSALDFLCKHVA